MPPVFFRKNICILLLEGKLQENCHPFQVLNQDLVWQDRINSLKKV